MIKKIAVALSLLLCAVAPGRAQFADQATYAGAGGGTANAQTITLSNASSYADVVGVLIKYVPSATNTGAATLNINGFGSSPSFRKPNGSGITALVGGEIVSGQPTYVMYDGTYFDIVSPTNLPIGAAQYKNSALSFGVPVNLQLNATVGSNQLTIAIKGNDGNDPSSTNPVLIPFRDSTISNGGPVVVSLQSALSFTIASGSTMGCVSGQMCRLWITAINNGGTPALCAFNALSGRNVQPINEAAVQTSASGTSGGNSAQVYYCSTSAVTAKSIRILGYVEVQEVTAGTWATGPTYVQLFGPGIKKPGDVVQILSSTTSSATTVNGTTPGVTTSTQAITPTSAANVVRASAFGNIVVGASTGIAQIYRAVGGSAACTTAIGNKTASSVVGDGAGAMLGIDVPNSSSQQTYTVCTYSNTGAINSQWCSQTDYPGVCLIELEEIMSEIRKPANDNASVGLRMVG